MSAKEGTLTETNFARASEREALKGLFDALGKAGPTGNFAAHDLRRIIVATQQWSALASSKLPSEDREALHNLLAKVERKAQTSIWVDMF